MAFFLLLLASHMATSPSSNSNNCTIYQDKIIGSKRAFLRVTRSSVEECCSLCGNTAGCMSWNFESADRMTCYLQKDAGDIKDKQGAVSGQCSSPQPLRWSKLVDTAGHRLRAPATHAMPSSIGSARFFPSNIYADTCNIDESTPIF